MLAIKTRTAVAVTAVLLLPLAILTGCGPAATAGHSPTSVKLTDCYGRQIPRPGIVQVICQSDAIMARSLAWSGWGKPVATAIGSAVYDWCAFEDCHTGTYNSAPIVLIASKIINCRKHTHVYSRLQYVFVGKSPFAGLPAHMNTSNYMNPATTSGPPANDTVLLAC